MRNRGALNHRRWEAAHRKIVNACSRPVADVAVWPTFSQALAMIFYASALLLGFVGGIVIGACVYGRWRHPALWLWVALPLIIYSAVMFWGGVEGGPTAWSDAGGWWLIGILGYVGLPMLVFAGTSALGFFVVPAPKAAWRLKDWRLPQ